MKHLFTFLFLLPLLSFGQTNYVANTANSDSPGTSNTIIGPNAANTSLSGDENVVIGIKAGALAVTTSRNTYVGGSAGNSNITGIENTAIGYAAGYGNRSSSNTYLGAYAGANGIPGSSNTFIGYNTKSTAQTRITNATAIGANAIVKTSNAIVLGDTITNTKVGIGITVPEFPLDVRGIINLRNNGTLKFSHLFNPNLRNGTTDQFLTVNEQGETVLAKYRYQIANSSEWADRVFETGYSLKPLAEVESYINTHKHLPGVPTTEQVMSEGADPVKLNALLLEKVEELTLHSIKLEKTNRQQQVQIDELKLLVNELLKRVR